MLLWQATTLTLNKTTGCTQRDYRWPWFVALARHNQTVLSHHQTKRTHSWFILLMFVSQGQTYFTIGFFLSWLIPVADNERLQIATGEVVNRDDLNSKSDGPFAPPNETDPQLIYFAYVCVSRPDLLHHRFLSVLANSCRRQWKTSDSNWRDGQ